jgi:hypothetical protein
VPVPRTEVSKEFLTEIALPDEWAPRSGGDPKDLAPHFVHREGVLDEEAPPRASMRPAMLSFAWSSPNRSPAIAVSDLLYSWRRMLPQSSCMRMSLPTDSDGDDGVHAGEAQVGRRIIGDQMVARGAVIVLSHRRARRQ